MYVSFQTSLLKAPIIFFIYNCTLLCMYIFVPFWRTSLHHTVSHSTTGVQFTAPHGTTIEQRLYNFCTTTHHHCPRIVQLSRTTFSQDLYNIISGREVGQNWVQRLKFEKFETKFGVFELSLDPLAGSDDPL